MAKRRVPPIARIRLARSLPRLLAWPAVVVATGIMAGASWWFGSFGSGIGGLVFAVLGGVLVLVGLGVALLLLSIRLQVHEAAIHLSWLGGRRVYLLTRGPVTRVRLRGPDASSLRPRFGMFGWAIGTARLRGEEDISVVRLARTRTAILVPTEHGRLAIAAADEDALLDALSRAARARQRLEELTDVTRPAEAVADAEADTVAKAPGDMDAPPDAGGVSEPAPEPERASEPEPRPTFLTGIERALLEQRLAEQRAAAETAAGEGAAGAVPDDVSPHPDDAAGAVAPEDAAPAAAAAGRPSRRPALAFVLLPLLGAGAAWAAGSLLGTYPDPQSDTGRLTTLALVLAGPATAVGAAMARTWWPRLVGVVVAGGLAASVFIGRALLG